MRHSPRAACTLLALCAAACATVPPDRGAAPDAAAPATDAPPPHAADDAAPACTPPPAPHCTRDGCALAPLALPTCAPDPGPEFEFYNADQCASRVTLLVFVAGWCSVCQGEAARVESEITAPYAARGVRVVNVIAQLPSGAPGTAAFCETWRTRYGLTSQMTHDPDARTRSFWPTNTFPVWLLVDREGRIRYRTQHGDGGVSALRARIDALLAEP